MTRSITQRDIAKAANLSIAAVSKALAGHPRMSAKTRRRVLKISRDLNYQPRRRSHDRVLLRRSRARISVCIVDSGPDAGSADGSLSPIASCAENYDMKIELCVVDELDLDAQVRRISAETDECDGVMLYGRSVSHELLARLAEDGVGPLVMLGSVEGDPLRQDMNTVCVTSDCAAMGQLATRAMLKLGHRRIAFFYYAEALLGMWNERWLAGFRHAHADAGCLPDPELIRRIEVKDRHYVGIAAANWVLEQADEPDAFVFPNEYAAARFLGTLRESGRSVAKDRMVVGGDYERACDHGLEIYPLITQDTPAMIDAVVQLLRRAIDGRPLPPGRMTVPFHVHNLPAESRLPATTAGATGESP